MGMGRGHPLSRMSSGTRSKTFWVLLAATIAWTILLALIDGPVQTDAAPIGMVSFELARSSESAQAMLDSWNHHAQLHLALSLGLDYVYLLLYSSTIAVACLWVVDVPASKARGVMGSMIPVGNTMAWMAWGAALLDAVENYALFKVLLTGPSAPWPALAFGFALVKFIVLAVTISFVVSMAVYRLTKR
jgi:hypothetical protein